MATVLNHRIVRVLELVQDKKLGLLNQQWPKPLDKLVFVDKTRTLVNCNKVNNKHKTLFLEKTLFNIPQANKGLKLNIETW